MLNYQRVNLNPQADPNSCHVICVPNVAINLQSRRIVSLADEKSHVQISKNVR